MRCDRCGYENEDGARFCNRCGAMLNGTADDGEKVSEVYKPITMWGYFGYELLFNIPIAGFILIIVFSFGGTKNLNLRNFARSYFCMVIIVAVLLAIMLAVIVGIAGTATPNNSLGIL